MLVAKKAKQIASEHLVEYADLPRTTFPMTRKYVPYLAHRMFEARYLDPTTGETHILLEFCVTDEGQVEVKDDNRERVRARLARKGRTLPDSSTKPMSPINAIAQFRRAFEDTSLEHPEWFLHIDLNPESRRSDAIARIRSLSGSALHVPIIVCRTRREKTSHFQQLKVSETARRVGIIVPLDLSTDNIRKRLFAALSNFRNHER